MEVALKLLRFVEKLLSVWDNRVVRGAGGQYSLINKLIGMQRMQNTLFLVLLRPIFALKAKIPSASALRI